MKTKNYEVSFYLNGKLFHEVVQTTDSYRARLLIQSRYAGAKIINVNEVK